MYYKEIQQKLFFLNVCNQEIAKFLKISGSIYMYYNKAYVKKWYAFQSIISHKTTLIYFYGERDVDCESKVIYSSTNSSWQRNDTRGAPWSGKMESLKARAPVWTDQYSF